MNSLLNWFARIEQRFRASLERHIVGSQELSTPKSVLIGGLRLWLRFRSHILRFAVRHGLVSPKEGLTVIMNLVLNPGDVFLDIGANIGSVTERAAYLVGRHGMVHSFEPSPTVCRNFLRKRVAALGLGNVEINEIALGKITGISTLYEFSETNGAPSSLRPGAWPGHQHSAETAVSVLTLDNYLAEKRLGPICLVKIDVQGSEIDVLSGSSILLNSVHRPILFVELEKDASTPFNHTIGDLLSVIAGFGYEALSWRDQRLVRVNSEDDLPEGGHDDVICLDPLRHSEIHQQLQRLAK
jgi:FkbM family methyltransferase